MNVFRVDLTINSGYILEEYEPVWVAVLCEVRTERSDIMRAELSGLDRATSRWRHYIL